MSREMKFEVWFERKKYSKVFQKSAVPKDQFFLGYYTLDEIIEAFNKEDCVFENSTIKPVFNNAKRNIRYSKYYDYGNHIRY